MTKIGFVLGSTNPPSTLRATAQAIERAGFDSIWMSEDYFMTGGVAGAGIVLGATERIRVGIGLLPIYSRHPALAAMEAATLAGAYPGRFTLGFGTGVHAWLNQMGIDYKAPLGSMRQSVETVRRLLEGETVSESGRFFFDDVTLKFPPSQVPEVYVGATGPKMTALAGEVADGVLLSVLGGTEFVRRSRRMISAAEAEHQKTKVTAFAIFSLAETTEAARLAARPVIADYLSIGSGQNDLTIEAGINNELASMLAEGGRDLVEREMPDSWVDMLSVSGDGETCRNAILALGAAGADEVALMPVKSSDLAAQVEAAGLSLRLSETT